MTAHSASEADTGLRRIVESLFLAVLLRSAGTLPGPRRGPESGVPSWFRKLVSKIHQRLKVFGTRGDNEAPKISRVTPIRNFLDIVADVEAEIHFDEKCSFLLNERRKCFVLLPLRVLVFCR